MTLRVSARNLFFHRWCLDSLFTYSFPIFIFQLISIIYTIHRAQCLSIKVAEDGFDGFDAFKQIDVSTQTHFYHVPLKNGVKVLSDFS